MLYSNYVLASALGTPPFKQPSAQPVRCLAPLIKLPCEEYIPNLICNGVFQLVAVQGAFFYL